MTLAESLSYWSGMKGFKSLNALSIQSGVPYATLRDISKGTTEDTRLSTLKALSATFGITLDELLDGPGDIEKAPAPKERELTEKDKQIMAMLPYVPDAVKEGILLILDAAVDLTAAEESANSHIEQALALREQSDDAEKQAARNG